MRIFSKLWTSLFLCAVTAKMLMQTPKEHSILSCAVVVLLVTLLLSTGGALPTDGIVGEAPLLPQHKQRSLDLSNVSNVIDSPDVKTDVNFKVTRRVSHVEFEVSEVGPVASTIPAPTKEMKPTAPIATSGVELPTADKGDGISVSPVFVPKINLDGSPLPPKSTFLSADVTGEIMKKNPVVSSFNSQPRVVSSYSSMSTGDSGTQKNALQNNETDSFNNDTTRDFNILSTTERLHDISSLLPTSFRELSSSTPRATSLESEEENDAVSTIKDTLLIVRTTTSQPKPVSLDELLLNHDNTFKREAVEKSLSIYTNKNEDSMFQDYEKEDVSVFVNDLTEPLLYRKEVKDKKKPLKENSGADDKVEANVNEDTTENSLNLESNNITSVEKEIYIKAQIISNDKEIKNVDTTELLFSTEKSTTIIPELEDILEKGEVISPFIIKPEDHIPRLSFPLLTKEQMSLKESESEETLLNLSSETEIFDSDTSEPFFDGELPTAAAVAEAPALTHYTKQKQSSSLDSGLMADKHILQQSLSDEGPKLSRGVSASRADSFTSAYVAATICGVILAIVLIVGVVLFALYQRKLLNRPKHLDRTGYAGSDSGGYLDDQCQSSYTTSHLDIPKGCPDDLISLDNDSFLNSLESMTIQNLWTDNIKHTKL